MTPNFRLLTLDLRSLATTTLHFSLWTLHLRSATLTLDFRLLTFNLRSAPPATFSYI